MPAAKIWYVWFNRATDPTKMTIEGQRWHISKAKAATPRAAWVYRLREYRYRKQENFRLWLVQGNKLLWEIPNASSEED